MPCFLSNVSRSDFHQSFLLVSFSYSSLSEAHESSANIQIMFLQAPFHHHPYLDLVLPNFLDLLGLHAPTLDAFFFRPMCNTYSAHRILLNFLPLTILDKQHTLQAPHYSYVTFLVLFFCSKLGQILISEFVLKKNSIHVTLSAISRPQEEVRVHICQLTRRHVLEDLNQAPLSKHSTL